MKVVAAALALLPLACVAAEPIMPTAEGMSWNYKKTEEVGGSGSTPEEQGKSDLSVTHRINGIQKVDGKDLLRFERHQVGSILNTDLLAIDEKGIICSAQIGEDGKLVKLV